MRVVCILAILLSFSDAEPILSFLTDGENKTSTSLENKDQKLDDLSILRQMINQETVIRLALVKNVHALVNDVILMKKSLAASEARVNGQLQTIDALNIQLNSLQQENNELKNSSSISEARIMELETKLQSVNENYGTLHDKLNVIQKDSDDKRREMYNKTHSVLDDIKIEVRYLSVTLLDFKESTETENESRDKKYEELERYFTNSFEELKAKIVQNKLNLTNNKVLIQNLDDSQSDIRETFTEILSRTVTKFETQLKTSEYEQLKLSSAVASLEVANMNLSRLNCDKSNHHAFTAGISTRNADWTGGTLVFPVVIYSVGTGYNPSTGIFTAPTAGTYVFYVSVQSAHQKYIYLDIVLNGSSKVRAMAWYRSGSSISIYQTGTNLVILHLQTGDRVWVKRAFGTGYYSDSAPVTTFSGFKLY
ncbi:putative leucine-rich repeat-containing protein DDB_G0290503 [Magallana gigas]|uniref:putative leucine-rich repeat-containing protein DDB_G0290503 n=1 Tax=Magallana gigas TaxID=29159 RepID=UPI003340CF2A